MTGIPAPKKYSNFPIANAVTDNMIFLVADTQAGTNWQVSANTLFWYLEGRLLGLLPLPATDIVPTSLELTANTTIDSTYNNQIVYYRGNTNITLTMANTLPDNFKIDVINFSATSNVSFNYNGFNVLDTQSVLSEGRISFMKIANTIIGK